MGTSLGRLAVLEFDTVGGHPDEDRIVAARIAITDDDGSERAHWEWVADGGDFLVGEVAAALRALLAAEIPLAMYDAATGLTVFDRECRRRHLDALEDPLPVLDALVLDHLVASDPDGRRSLEDLARRYGVGGGRFAAGRVVRAITDRGLLSGSARDIHRRQAEHAPGWPVLDLEDIRIIEDTVPAPAPPLRPSDTVPVVDFSPRGLPTMEPDRVHVAAAIVTDAGGRALMVRSRGTTSFGQPGAVIEPGETAVEALGREIAELGLDVEPDETVFLGSFELGSFEAPAFEDSRARVRAEVFAVRTEARAQPGPRIEEIAWLESPEDGEDMEVTPLARDVLIPLWAARRLTLF